MLQACLLEQLLQLSGNCITNLGSGSCAGDVTGTHTSLDNVADGLLNELGFLEETEGVLEHETNGKDSSDGVDDSLASNVGGRS